MNLLPKCHLKWKQPKTIVLAMDEMARRELSPWSRPKVVMVMAAAFMLIWCVSKPRPGNTPLPFSQALAVALAGGLVLTYVVPWLTRLCPSYVSVLEHGILRARGRSVVTWKYADIDHCELATMTAQGRDHAALVIHTTGGQRIPLGVPTDLVPKLREVLAQLNVVMTPPGQPGGAPGSDLARSTASHGPA